MRAVGSSRRSAWAPPVFSEGGERCRKVPRPARSMEGVVHVRRGREPLESGTARARDQGHVFALAQLLLTHGMVYRSQQKWTEAEQVLQETLGLTRSMPWPLVKGRALSQLGALAVRRDTHEASELTNQALAIFERLGAREDAEDLRLLQGFTPSSV